MRLDQFMLRPHKGDAVLICETPEWFGSCREKKEERPLAII